MDQSETVFVVAVALRFLTLALIHVALTLPYNSAQVKRIVFRNCDIINQYGMSTEMEIQVIEDILRDSASKESGTHFTRSLPIKKGKLRMSSKYHKLKIKHVVWIFSTLGNNLETYEMI